MSKELIYRCNICREKRDERCFIGIGKDSDKDKDMYFDDIHKTNIHVCVACINNIAAYMDRAFTKVEDRWKFKKNKEREA